MSSAAAGSRHCLPPWSGPRGPKPGLSPRPKHLPRLLPRPQSRKLTPPKVRADKNHEAARLFTREYCKIRVRAQV
jgi:hypothetical protein